MTLGFVWLLLPQRCGVAHVIFLVYQVRRTYSKKALTIQISQERKTAKMLLDEDPATVR